MDLRGQTAVVTGASSGIGRAIALALAGCGTALTLVGRSAGALAEVAEAARLLGAQARALLADLADPADVERLCADLAAGPPTDLLVHSAGYYRAARAEQATMEDFDRHFQVNARAPYRITQALAPALRGRRGQVVFVNSSAALAPRGGVGQYAASKAALRALADSLRDELNPAGVRVLSVFPGRTASPMQAAIMAAEGREYRPDLLLQPEDVAAVVLQALALPRTAEVTELNVRPLNKLP